MIEAKEMKTPEDCLPQFSISYNMSTLPDPEGHPVPRYKNTDSGRGPPYVVGGSLKAGHIRLVPRFAHSSR